MGKMQLKQKPQSNKPKLQLRPVGGIMPAFGRAQYYSSGYAFTDNKTFCFFGVDEKILLDTFGKDGVLGFHFSEEMVDMRIDRNTQLVPMPIDDHTVSIGHLGSVQKSIVQQIFKVAPKAIVHPITEWFGEPVNTLACCLENGRLVAVVKTQ